MRVIVLVGNVESRNSITLDRVSEMARRCTWGPKSDAPACFSGQERRWRKSLESAE
jgi:hypothetical protein